MKAFPLKSIEELKPLVNTQRHLPDLRLGRILIDAGLITEKDLSAILLQQKQIPGGKPLGQKLIAMGKANQNQIDIAMATKLGIPLISLKDFEISPDILARIPVDIALQHHVLPLGEIGGRLVVAMENPLNQDLLDTLRFTTGAVLDVVMASPQDITLALSRYYSTQDESKALQDIKTDLLTTSSSLGQPTKGEEEEAQKKPIIRLLNSILLHGITHGASDINIRPEKTAIKVFYRVDGKLQYARTLNKTLLPPLVSRIKIIGQMDIAEHRVPQDGHTRLIKGEKAIDLRISIIPTIHGESVVIRILDKELGLKPLDQLGLSPRDVGIIRQLLTKPHGMFLVTGPTGSGKTTTLYALINEIRARNPHILTVEDPVEYELEGVEQVQIAPERGATFPRVLRHFLRHDPDVIMIGEIRDEETARIANMAALTGHVVLSTLHTNDAAGSIARLLDMGVESYLLNSTLLGVMAQRLVRLNCTKCAAEEAVDPVMRRVLNLRLSDAFYRGKGCAACNHTGYAGRATVCELMPISPQIATMINARKTSAEITQQALSEGMVRLTDNALSLAKTGKTSIEEVFALRFDA